MKLSRQIPAARIAAALGCAAVLAGPAAADDLRFPSRDATSLNMRAAGQPFWALLADCAGTYGAGANWYAAHGDQDNADRMASRGTTLMREAMSRLQHDRGLNEADAKGTAAQMVYAGRDTAALFLDRERGPNETWNLKTASCEQIQQSHHQHRG